MRDEKPSGTRIVPIPSEWARRPTPCQHPEHDPPRMIVIPPGHMLEHTCPGCGRFTRVMGPQRTFLTGSRQVDWYQMASAAAESLDAWWRAKRAGAKEGDRR